MPQRPEPRINLFCHYNGRRWQIIIFPRRQHRPSVYDKSGSEQILISPGAVDMGGVVVIPRLADYHRLDLDTLKNIFQEVTLTDRDLDKVTALL